VNAEPCVVAPSPNDQFQVVPVTAELTVKVSGTPVVPLAETFRTADGDWPAGGGADVEGGTDTTDFAVSPLTVADTVAALSLEDVNVVVAVPDAPVATALGATSPLVALKATTTPLTGEPLAFCTRAVMLTVPTCVPVPDRVPKVTGTGPSDPSTASVPAGQDLCRSTPLRGQRRRERRA